MMDWWNSLDDVNKGFYISAAFFSVFFVWQLIAVLLGFGGDEAGDGDVADADVADGAHDAYHDFDDGAVHDAHDTAVAFKLFSFRSFVAFFTLFSWAGALYLQSGTGLTMSLVYSLIWGLVAMFVISGIFSLLYRLTETGNVRFSTAVGTRGTVYVDVPEGGVGEIRVTISRVVTVAKARSHDGSAIKAGTQITVKRLLGPTVFEIKPIDDHTL